MAVRQMPRASTVGIATRRFTNWTVGTQLMRDMPRLPFLRIQIERPQRAISLYDRSSAATM